MNNVLKLGQDNLGQRVRPFTARTLSPAAEATTQPSVGADSAMPTSAQPGTPAADAADAIGAAQEIATLQAKLHQAEREAERLGKELEDLSARTETLQNEAFEKGRKEGLQQSGEDSSQRLDLLKAGLAAAMKESERKSTEAEILALQLAKVAVTRVLGNEAEFVDLLPQVIRHQLDRFRNSKPTALHVASSDFSDADAVAALAAEFPQLRLVVERDFKPGTCQLSLQLGEVEIGLPGQVERLGEWLDEMSCASAKAYGAASADQSQEVPS